MGFWEDALKRAKTRLKEAEADRQALIAAHETRARIAEATREVEYFKGRIAELEKQAAADS